jgi:NADH:ubiquinone oxidoreductase subunit F (NADH-binding)
VRAAFPTSTLDELPADALPRLLPPMPLRTLAEHRDRFGPCPAPADALIGEIDRSGLKGHGGAAFPTAVKLRAVAERRGPKFVVANGTEGEPASGKDKTLLSIAPHLVLDGAVLAATAVGARDVVVCIDRGSPQVAAIVRAAIDERARRRLDPVKVRLEAAPHRYVAGEETALVAWLNGGDAKPTFTPPRPFERGVRNRPTLVQNVETLAHIALIARRGAAWFRALGTATDPGTALVTCTGAFGRTGVFEVPLGMPLHDLCRATGTDLRDVQAVLVGGYFGTWLPAAVVRTSRFGSESLRQHGAALGCGVLAALPHTSCGLTEQNAGQCGPCVFGLDSIARAMSALAKGDRAGKAEVQLRRWLEMVKGRGACKHPDGTARFVESSLHVFADEIERHRRSGPCHESHRPALLPTPHVGGWR